jgi:hypothetical protein
MAGIGDLAAYATMPACAFTLVGWVAASISGVVVALIPGFTPGSARILRIALNSR